METVGHRLKAARERALLTQPQLSQRANVAVVTISRLETGDSPYPRAETVKRLAAALDINAAALMWGEEPKRQRRGHREAPSRD